MYSRLTVVDESMLDDHYYLDEDDYCTFMGEYTARQGYTYSQTNQLISNFKKPVNSRGTNQWTHKQRAIQVVANSLVTCLSPWADEVTLVPVPPSKCATDADYDNRMAAALNLCQSANPNIDYRELVTQNISTEAAHLSAHRPIPQDLVDIYSIEPALIHNVRDTIIVVDDMLTSGCHYKAMQTVLQNNFPDHKIAGVFIARRVPLADFNLPFT